MLGLAEYSSEEEVTQNGQAKDDATSDPPATVEPTLQNQSTTEAHGADSTPVAGAIAKAKAPPPEKAAPKVNNKKLLEIKREIGKAKSATAVVQVVRQSMEHWDRRWGAEALFQVAKRSTARTRREWAKDKGVLKIASKLKAESSVEAIPSGYVDSEDADTILLSLEALRRMEMQPTREQQAPLEVMVSRLEAAKWKYPVRTLSRLFWMAAPLKLKGLDSLPAELRPRYSELTGSDLALLVAAMQQKGARDLALLERIVGCLKEKNVHDGLAATDLVELAEGLAALEQTDEEALRPLGQELQRRRGELTPDEAHRIQNAFQKVKLPLSQVWTKPGAVTKRDASSIVTTQAFVPQEGHEKKRRGNNDVERTSPPRVVRDYKMMSY